MFSVLKFIWIIFTAIRQSGTNLLNPDVNPLRHMPPYIRYFASILISCFWCLAFGLYIGELLTIGYNMIGHIAIISMVFVTWGAFKTSEKVYGPSRGVMYLRMPDHSSRCDELTDQQRAKAVNRADELLKLKDSP